MLCYNACVEKGKIMQSNKNRDRQYITVADDDFLRSSSVNTAFAGGTTGIKKLFKEYGTPESVGRGNETFQS